jgi:Gas vesicle synthesis protein GvpL/GvpF
MTAERDPLERLRSSIDEAASLDLADVVQEARLEARTKVRAILAEALADKLLDLAARELSGQPSHGGAAPAHSEPLRKDRSQAAAEVQEASTGGNADTTPDADDARSAGSAPEQGTRGFGCYVYGVVGAEAELEPMTGLDGLHDVFLIRGESIAAVASRVSLDEFGETTLQEHLDDIAWLERQARRHEHILDGVREQTALVPMRLCTIYRDEQSVREMLAREHAFLADALNRLEGRTEWGVKLYLTSPPDASPRDAAEAEASDVAAPGSGAGYLRQRQVRDRRRERSEVELEEHCRRAHSELSQIAVEAKMNPVQPRELTNRDEPMLFNGVYLVDDAAADDFTGVVANLQSHFAPRGLELELTGPWPPYNFVNSPTEVGR